jgi:glucose-6-phosphate isomerase, archaeal
MSTSTEPFAAALDAVTGRVSPQGPLQERRLSDLDGLYADDEAYRAAVEQGDPLVYTVSVAPVPEEAGQVPFSITTIEPGDVAGELYMTKGHWHTAEEGEVYLGLTGQGGLLLFDGSEHRWIDLTDGAVGYIPPNWAHRTVNTGDEPFRFLAIYPGAAGHDYQRVLSGGMGARVIRDGEGRGYEVRAVEGPR